MKRNEWTKFFTRSVRSDGTAYYHKTDDCPAALDDFAFKVHRNLFYDSSPNDWIYEQLARAFDDLSENEYGEEAEADIYNSDLYKWLGNSFADEFVQEALDEGLADPQKTNFWEMVRYGQWLAKDRLYRAVDEFLSDESDDDTEEDTAHE